MTNTLNTSEVSDLEFIRVSDLISHKWADWEVNFTFEGKPYFGFLGACPYHPDMMQDVTIENCELNF